MRPPSRPHCQHNTASTRYFAIAGGVAKIDQQAFDAFRIALTNAKFNFLIQIFVVSNNWSARCEPPTDANLVRGDPAALASKRRFTLGRNALPGGHLADPQSQPYPIAILPPSPVVRFRPRVTCSIRSEAELSAAATATCVACARSLEATRASCSAVSSSSSRRTRLP